MWVPTVIGYIFCLLLSIWGIQYHINVFRYPLHTSISLTLAVFIPLSIILLLPIDYVSHNTKETIPWFSLPDHVILILWKTNYWVTFLLTWLILPMLQEYYRSGAFERLSKLKDAFKKNLKFQLAILGVSVVGIIYLLLEAGLSFNHIKLMVIAMSHIYSLVLALWLMAHGLISIPRELWQEANHVTNLNHQYLKVPRAVDNLEDTKISFKEDVLQVLVLTKNFTSSSPEDFKYRDWILNLYSSIPDEFKDQMERQYLENSNNSIARDQLTTNFMTKLSASFNSNLHKYIAYESEFNALFVQISQLEDIIAAKSNLNAQQHNQLVYRVPTMSFLKPRTRFFFQIYVKPVFSRLVALILFAASIVVLQSEFFHSTHLSLINTIVYSTGIHNHSSLQLVVSSISFSYILFASLNSLTHLKIFNMYHLVRHRSDIVSACFYTTYIARLTIPLSYNFITLFYSRESIFETWFGKSIHLTGLFNLMNNWIPRFVLIPVVLTVFNVYDKLKKRLGLNSDLYDSWALFDTDDGENSTNIDNNGGNLQNKRKDMIIVEAKRMINREMFKRQQQDGTQHNENLRSFNLATAANTNYENNRRSFHDNLISRVDNEYHDDLDDDTSASSISQPWLSPVESITSPSNIWTSVGSALSGIRNQISTRFSSNREQSLISGQDSNGYRDDPIDGFDYDDDPEERMVL